MEKLLNKVGQVFPSPGDAVSGTVISIARREVLVDINGIVVGVIRGKELNDESGEMSHIKVGDTVQATVLDMENEKGILELSFRLVGHKKAWDQLSELKKTGETVNAIVIDANRGGLMMKVGGVLGFMPVSQLSSQNYPKVEGGDKNKILEKLKSFIGKVIEVKAISVDERENKLILSERSLSQDSLIRELKKFKVGEIVEGTITGVVDFGAFVEIDGGGEGLIHISEIDWARIDDPRQILKNGDRIKAQIIDLSEGRASLSIKRLKKDPWREEIKKYSIGQVVEGSVVKINPFGAFIEIEPSIQGLAHISELSQNKISLPQDILKEGEIKKFKIISIDPESHRLGLSLK